jgi:hypothetical protein
VVPPLTPRLLLKKFHVLLERKDRDPSVQRSLGASQEHRSILSARMRFPVSREDLLPSKILVTKGYQM